MAHLYAVERKPRHPSVGHGLMNAARAGATASPAAAASLSFVASTSSYSAGTFVGSICITRLRRALKRAMRWYRAANSLLYSISLAS